MKITINELNTELQTRAFTDREVVEDYAELMKGGASFPNVKVFRTSSPTMYYLVDGFHRVEAARLNGATEIEADVIDGDHGAALAYALKANATHGLRRSNADKRHALEIAWANRSELFTEMLGEDRNGHRTGLPSSYQLASVCGVSQRSAASFIKDEGVSNLLTPSAEAAEPSDAVAAENLHSGKDRFDLAIPERLLPAFTSAAPSAVRAGLRAAKKALVTALKANDPAVQSLGQQVLVNIENALTGLKFHRPFCVCRACRGEGCGYCRDVGFQTKAQYDRLPHEFKAEKA